MKKSLFCIVLAVLAAATASARDGEDQRAKLPPPPQVKQGEVIEPEVTIIEKKDRTVEQYSVNGRVYMIKVTPSAGPPYYLYDLDGDGRMDVRQDSPMDIGIPQWVLFSW